MASSTAEVLYCLNSPLPFLPFFTPITPSLCKNPESFHNKQIPKVPLSSPCFITTNSTTPNSKRIPKIPSSRSSWRSNSYPEPETSESQCPVPGEQLPINEYRSLSASFPFSWAAGDSAHHLPSRLLTTAVSFALFVGLPVASCSPTSADFELARRLLGAVSSGVFAATLVAVRMYLGWAYVGNRLFSATVPYEETGWYDGQVWVKTAEVLARDRLLGTFSVKPVLSRLKFTLVVLAAILLASVLLLINLEGNQKDLYISEEHTSRVIAGVYNEQSARLFEPDAYCGEPDLP